MTTEFDKHTISLDDEIFHLIKEELIELGVQMDGCPPMWYPEAIHNLFVWTAMAARDCTIFHDFHKMDLRATRQCLVASIKEMAKASELDKKEGR